VSVIGLYKIHIRIYCDSFRVRIEIKFVSTL